MNTVSKNKVSLMLLLFALALVLSGVYPNTPITKAVADNSVCSNLK